MTFEGMDPGAQNCQAFVLACANGRLDIAKWLMTFEGMDPCAQDCEAFIRACRHGRLDIAKWLMTFEGMDPGAQNCQAFVWACWSNCLEMAKWLLTLEDMDPCVWDYEVFEYAYYNDHPDILKLLLSLPGLCEELKRLDATEDHAIFHKKSSDNFDKGIRALLIDKRRSNFATAKLFIREVVALPEELCLKILWTACGDGDIAPIGTAERKFNDNLISAFYKVV